MKIKWFPHKSEFPIDPRQLTATFYADRKIPFIVGLILLVFAGLSSWEVWKQTEFGFQVAWTVPVLILLVGVGYYLFKSFYVKDAIAVGFTDHDIYVYMEGYGYIKCPWDAIESTEIVTVIVPHFGRPSRQDEYHYLLILIKPEYSASVMPAEYVKYISRKPARGLGGYQERKIVVSELGGPILLDLKEKIDARIAAS